MHVDLMLFSVTPGMQRQSLTINHCEKKSILDLGQAKKARHSLRTSLKVVSSVTTSNIKFRIVGVFTPCKYDNKLCFFRISRYACLTYYYIICTHSS